MPWEQVWTGPPLEMDAATLDRWYKLAQCSIEAPMEWRLMINKLIDEVRHWRAVQAHAFGAAALESHLAHLAGKCGKGGCATLAAEPHPCPYQSDVNDRAVACRCCTACTKDCLDDI